MPKILVIDDSTFLRTYLRGFLEEAGYEVEDFMPISALEVMEKAKACLPDLVLTDYSMPHVTGLEVTRMIRRYSRHLPVLVLTAIRDPDKEAILRKYEPLQVLHKPLKGEEIVAIIRKVLAPASKVDQSQDLPRP